MPNALQDPEAGSKSAVPASGSTLRAATPQLISPPDTRTPPTEAHKRHQDLRDRPRAFRDPSSDPIDPAALSRALHKFERQRDHTPGPSPSRKRQRMQDDRFIPNRANVDFQVNFRTAEEHDPTPSTPSRSHRLSQTGLNIQRRDEANRTYESLLRTELFDDSISRSGTPSTPARKSIFNFSTRSGHPTPHSLPRSQRGPNMNPHSELYSLSPIKRSSQSMLLEPRKQPRAVSKVPFKVLDAPDLADDFYLNLVDWGSQNILGVGLNNCVYLWNSETGKVNPLCELSDGDTVTSVSWIQRGSHIAIGTNKGFVQIWDAVEARRLRTMTGHTARVGALAWNDHILTSGSRDRLIYHRDVRQPDQWIRKLAGHKQEVCGLKWNPDDGQLASGGNDNSLMIWEKLNAEPTYKWREHQAAVKAISWSPHQRGLLASGGGTADRCIKFWNTLVSPYASTSAARPAVDPSTPTNLIRSIDTGSQVCNLAWSTNSNELVSTHGYSQNQIIVWKYPSMQQVVSLTGHTFRVLYLAMSPDGQTIVTGAGDETLRFWNAFKKRQPAEDDTFLGIGTNEIIR